MKNKKQENKKTCVEEARDYLLGMKRLINQSQDLVTQKLKAFL